MTDVHIALFKWKPDATNSEIDEALKDLAALAGEVPGIIEIWAGANTSPFSEGYTHVVLVRAETPEALQAYRTHPDHVRVGEVIHAMQEHGVGARFATNP